MDVKDSIGFGMMILGLALAVIASTTFGHTFGESDYPYHAAMTYAMLLIGVGGVITNSKSGMVIGCLMLLGLAFIVNTYMVRLTAAGLL